MIQKIFAVISQILIIFCLIYSTAVQEAVVPCYMFFPLNIICIESFKNTNFKKGTVLVTFFCLIQIVYAVFLLREKTSHTSYFTQLLIALMYVVYGLVTWLIKIIKNAKKDKSKNRTGDGSVCD